MFCVCWGARHVCAFMCFCSLTVHVYVCVLGVCIWHVCLRVHMHTHSASFMITGL